MRWDFVFQRPQHLLTRFARESRVFYVEEPEFSPGISPALSVSLRENGVHVVVPRLPEGLEAEEATSLQKDLLDELLRRYAIRQYVLWYYTPMALGFSETGTEPADQAAIPGPRLGFFGVIDERMDLDLVGGIAAARPDWQLVFLGPTCKIDPASFPALPNIHRLGRKAYADLPAYVAGWDVALLPFARNDSTKFISPTKTPEYLAAGKPVVSTSIRDVVRPYGQQGLARIADTVPEFVAAVEATLAEDPKDRIARADAFLSRLSWERTWSGIRRLLLESSDARGTEAAGSDALAG
ncbi:MAG: glycosyltransferase [Acidobacteria bacterium]|nr:glycosyltransferase [Acidobacteriota bacterium]